LLSENSCSYATIVSMQASDIAAIVNEVATTEASPEAQETAARISALLRHLFLYDRGNLLRVIEESGLSMTQSTALLELGGLGEEAEARQVGDLAETLGVSVPSMSRAVDGLVKKRLATRVEDPDDRRVRRVAITANGKKIVDTLVVVRQAGMETFAASLTAAQRRKLDAAVDSLMDREDIAEAYEHLKEVGP
jgi:DNA-binding MarR family transcriptional regulator